MTTIHVEYRPAAEFLLTIVAWSTPQRLDSYAVGPEWFARVGDLAGKNLGRRVTGLAAGCDHIVTRLFGVAAELSPQAGAAALIEAVEGLKPDVLRLTLLGYYARRTRRRMDPAVIAEAARGDADAGRRVIEATTDGPECEAAIAGVLAMRDEAALELVVGILRDWEAAVFRWHLGEVGEILERETEELRDRARILSPEDFLDEATTGAEVLETPGTDEVHVYPTWVLRPWNVVWEQASSILLGVPVAEHRLVTDPETPPDRLVQLAKALGDERRLRVLRRLTEGSYSLAELAEHFALPKSTLLHHLVILRSAGIVRVGAGPTGRYSLRAGMPLELHRLLDGYLPASRREPVSVRGTQRG